MGEELGEHTPRPGAQMLWQLKNDPSTAPVKTGSQCGSLEGSSDWHVGAEGWPQWRPAEQQLFLGALLPVRGLASPFNKGDFIFSFPSCLLSSW